MNTYFTKNCETAAGFGAFLALVAGAAANGAILPAAQNAAGYIGQSDDLGVLNQAIRIVRGRVRGVANGAITHGHWVRISNNLGQLEDCQTLVDAAPGAALTINVVGKADTDAVDQGQFLFWTRDFTVKTAVS